jgi:hypothetical protein
MPKKLTITLRILGHAERVAVQARSYKEQGVLPPLQVKQVIGPELSTVQDTQNTDRVTDDHIGGDVWRAADHQFPGARDATRTANPRKLQQRLNLGLDPFVNNNGCPGIICLDIIESRITIGACERTPFQSHPSRLPQRSGTTDSEMRLDLRVRDTRPRVVKRRLHLSPKQSIMGRRVLRQRKRQHAFICRPGQ